MNDGAGGLSAEEISGKLKALASGLSTGAGIDGASVSISCLSRNLNPTLDLMAQVIKEPTFPEEEWKLAKPRYVTAIQAARKDPTRIAGRVDGRLIYGDTYRGKIMMEADYEALTTADFKKFHATYVGPANAIILVGGAISADEAVAALEPRFGSWKPPGIQSPTVEVSPVPIDKPMLYFVDKPGASQSVISARTVVGHRTDPDWYKFELGIDVLGGTFMSRLNMNLREDKGYTYGARCGSDNRFGPSVVACSASVQTAVTGAALVEMRKELLQVVGERPIEDSELIYMKDSLINGYAGRFETPGALLGEQETIWRFGLPENLPDTYLPSIRAVDTKGAQAALVAWWKPERTIWLVVGDKSKILTEVQSFGLPIVELDADGKRIGG
jgi:zinc protease